jgi:hypothetical protein
MGAMDSPRLEQERFKTGSGVTLYNRLAQLEKRLYEQIPPPDIVLRPKNATARAMDGMEKLTWRLVIAKVRIGICSRPDLFTI